MHMTCALCSWRRGASLPCPKKDDTKKTRGAVTKENPVWQAIRHVSVAVICCEQRLSGTATPAQDGHRCALFVCRLETRYKLNCMLEMLHVLLGKDSSNQKILSYHKLQHTKFVEA